ncbi:MAG: hypothetical protein LC118_06470 [Dehalococcoidia bacterium]|nr:hypothetical protein [Dehalococcoidia bacterium]
MGTMTEDRDNSAATVLLHDGEIVSLPRCKRCNLSYIPAKSTSALRLTYCSFLCELGDLGFSMAGLETMERIKKEELEQPPAERLPLGVE